MKIKQCKAYGCEYHSFKVPKGSLFGEMNGAFFVIPRFPALKAWICTGEKWELRPCRGELKSAVSAWLQKNGIPTVEPYRPPYWEPYISKVTPRERRIQSDYLFRSKPVDGPLETRGGLVMSRDSSFDRGSIPDENLYWTIGKTENRTGHKLAGTKEKPRN